MNILWIFFLILAICCFFISKNIFVVILALCCLYIILNYITENLNLSSIFAFVWVFFVIVGFCLYVLFGLYITENIEHTRVLVFTWVIYTCLWITFINIFVLGYFWSTLRTKNGPPGLRGPEGENGERGDDGSCNTDAIKALLMFQISTYIDELYKEKTGNNIMNSENHQFPNTYLNNKILTQSASRQYSVLVASLNVHNKPIAELITYIKNIWKIWFDLIYDANPNWFNDATGDEDYQWVRPLGQDKTPTTSSAYSPFTEIKKYDMYYWGITRTFRPLKAEICRTSPNYQSSKLPTLNNTEPRLKIMFSNDYTKITDDKGTDGYPDASWWRPNQVIKGNDTYYPIGDILTAGDRNYVYWNLFKKGNTIIDDIQYDGKVDGKLGPDMKSLLVSGDVVDPITLLDWSTSIIGGRNDIASATPYCPTGYVSMGDVISSTNGGGGFKTDLKDKNETRPIKCVPADCVINTNNNNSAKAVWESDWGWDPKYYVLNHFDSTNNEATGENGYNVYRYKNLNPFYKINPKCLEPPPEGISNTKEPEKEFTDLGIGWYGHPYKLDPKYSIFTFLNLVPEGMIINKSTGRRFYIIHYGGEDVNIYNVLDYNYDTNKFDNGLQIDTAKNSARVISRPLTRTDARQQWTIIIKVDKTQLTLKNVMNKQSLFIGLEPVSGIIQFSTINLYNFSQQINKSKQIQSTYLTPNQISDNTTFTFVSTFGTQMNIIDNDKQSQQRFINGSRIRISSSNKQPINLFGILVYDSQGSLIKTMNDTQTKALASSSSVYQNHTATNALKIINENLTRNILQAIEGENLINKANNWNTYTLNGALCAYTDNKTLNVSGDNWVEYKFNSKTDNDANITIAGIELYFESVKYLERMDNVKIEIFKKADNGTDVDKLVWSDNTGNRNDNINSKGMKVFIIGTHGQIYN